MLKPETRVNARRDREAVTVNGWLFENRIRRVGKGASASCPPCRCKMQMVGTLALCPPYDCRHPPSGLAFGEPDDRLQRVIQYSRDVCD
jgi:hypothetical protein